MTGDPSTATVPTEPAEKKGELRELGGSDSYLFNNQIACQAVSALWVGHSDDETKSNQYGATAGALRGIAPRDELEGMMAAQLVAAHNASMECYRRAMLPDQTMEGRAMNLNQANKLSRTYSTLLDALNKHRGKGQQKVTVEHVHVHAGGQAVVGTVEGGGVASKPEGQAHARQVTDAHESPMRSPDSTADVVPITRDAER